MSSSRVVLEIGPGTGPLTNVIINAGAIEQYEECSTRLEIFYHTSICLLAQASLTCIWCNLALSEVWEASKQWAWEKHLLFVATNTPNATFHGI